MTPHQLTVVPPTGAPNWGDWRDHAACAGQDQTMFFPRSHEPSAEAKKICRDCPVRVDCLEFALAENIQHGIWGGLSINRRRDIRKQRYRAGLASTSGAIRPVPDVVPSAARPVLAPAQPSGRAAHPQ